MKMMLALTAMIVLAFSGLAMAQIDPDSDGMSVYFDPDGMVYCLTVDDWVAGPGAGPGVIDA